MDAMYSMNCTIWPDSWAGFVDRFGKDGQQKVLEFDLVQCDLNKWCHMWADEQHGSTCQQQATVR
jgi:hypothetical protein